jgi:hypothetical protein
MQIANLRLFVPFAAAVKIAATNGGEHIKTQTKRQNLLDRGKLYLSAIDNFICTFAVRLSGPASVTRPRRALSSRACHVTVILSSPTR